MTIKIEEAYKFNGNFQELLAFLSQLRLEHLKEVTTILHVSSYIEVEKFLGTSTGLPASTISVLAQEVNADKQVSGWTVWWRKTLKDFSAKAVNIIVDYLVYSRDDPYKFNASVIIYQHAGDLYLQFFNFPTKVKGWYKNADKKLLSDFSYEEDMGVPAGIDKDHYHKRLQIWKAITKDFAYSPASSGLTFECWNENLQRYVVKFYKEAIEKATKETTTEPIPEKEEGKYTEAWKNLVIEDT